MRFNKQKRAKAIENSVVIAIKTHNVNCHPRISIDIAKSWEGPSKIMGDEGGPRNKLP